VAGRWFSEVLRIPPPIKLTTTIQLKYCKTPSTIFIVEAHTVIVKYRTVIKVWFLSTTGGVSPVPVRTS
jgi:hypothetical protein